MSQLTVDSSQSKRDWILNPDWTSNLTRTHAHAKISSFSELWFRRSPLKGDFSIDDGFRFPSFYRRRYSQPGLTSFKHELKDNDALTVDCDVKLCTTKSTSALCQRRQNEVSTVTTTTPIEPVKIFLDLRFYFFFRATCLFSLFRSRSTEVICSAATELLKLLRRLTRRKLSMLKMRLTLL
jgi:hypothetical protein